MELIKTYDRCELNVHIDGYSNSDLKNDEKLSEVQQQLTLKGAQGFKLINSHIHASSEVKNDSFRYLFCIMEREYDDFDPLSSKSSSWDDIIPSKHSSPSDENQNDIGDD